MQHDNDKPRPLDEQAEFVMSLVDAAQKDRSPLEPVWDEVEQSFLVRPYTESNYGISTAYPFSNSGQSVGLAGHSVLKDSETHQQLVTMASMIVLGLFPDNRFVQAEMVGAEDVFRARTASRLLEHCFRLPGHFWSVVEWVFLTMLRGTGMMAGEWGYEEQPRNLRSITGQEDGSLLSSIETLMVPVYDDPRFRPLDLRDFFHDTGATSIQDSKYGIKRFRISVAEARRRIGDPDSGGYSQKAVNAAIERAARDDAKNRSDHPFTEPDQIAHDRKSHPEYRELIGYEFVGEQPFKSPDGIQRRVITVLGGETVRNHVWPRRLPFFDMRILPRPGSFFGISPGEVLRYDQDFVDVLKMMIADAVVLATHPPHIYNKNAMVDKRELRRWHPRVPIGVEGSIREAIGTAPYEPPLSASTVIQQQMKGQMRENTGILGAVQGLGLGSKRFSATEASETFNAARDRPELFAKIIEREYLPPPARFALELYQEFLEEDTDDVQRRVGATEMPVDISDILVDFDIRFVGSRQLGTLTERTAAAREIFQAASANPLVAQVIPWIPFLQEWFRDIGQAEVAAMIGDPQLVQTNLLLQQIAGTGATVNNGNGVPPAGRPIAQMPAQALGREDV